jgi:hypothetical protein
MTAIINNRGRWYEIGAWIDVPFILVDGQARLTEKRSESLQSIHFKLTEDLSRFLLEDIETRAAAVPACPPAGMVLTYLDSNNQPVIHRSNPSPTSIDGQALPGMLER